MVEYLLGDGRKWYAAELDLVDEPLLFVYEDDNMADILRNKLSEKGFVPCV